MTAPTLPICAKLRKFDWHVHTSQGSKPTSIPTEAADTIEALYEALEWYREHAEGCRKLGSIGAPFRHALDADGGKRAVTALTLAREGAPHDKQ